MLLLALACNHNKDSDVAPSPAILEEGPEITCAAPTGPGPARFSEQSNERGLDLDRTLFWGSVTSFDGNLVVQDMDLDGDFDVLMGRTAAVDMDGDQLPDLLMVGLGGLMMARNRGNWTFDDAEVLWLHEGNQVPLYTYMGIGDYDKDGDLDVALTGIDWLPKDIYASTDAAYDELGSPVILLTNKNGTFTPTLELTPTEEAGFSMYAVFTDRDEDGDEDLLVSSLQLCFSDRLAPQAFIEMTRQNFPTMHLLLG